MSYEILNLPVSKIIEAYKNKTLSPVDVVKASFAQIEQLQESLNPFIIINDEESLMKAAQASESRWAEGTPNGPIDGIPVTIKDDCDIAGWPMREGSLTTSDKPAIHDGPQPQRLQRHLAVPLKARLLDLALRRLESRKGHRAYLAVREIHRAN